MTTFFISDLHLDMEHPQTTDCLLRFLKTQAIKADALYILGDLFEVWIGDDEQNELTQKVSLAIKELRQKGIPVYFMHGNRDFLLGPTYSDSCGWQILNDPTIINLYQIPTLLMHGDTLCTQDQQYQAFRHRVRDPSYRRAFLQKSLAERRAIAAQIRAVSEKYTQGTAAEIMDVTPEEVAKTMQQYQITQIIHGHTHRPAIHQFTLTNQTVKRIVLGSWHKSGHILNYQANQEAYFTELSFD